MADRRILFYGVVYTFPAGTADSVIEAALQEPAEKLGLFPPDEEWDVKNGKIGKKV